MNRHVLDYDPLYAYLPNYTRENNVEYALRISQEWMNNRLDTTLLAIVLGAAFDQGAIIRAEANYDLLDALVVTAGFVAFAPGKTPPLSDWERNQRMFFKLKYSF